MLWENICNPTLLTILYLYKLFDYIYLTRKIIGLSLLSFKVVIRFNYKTCFKLIKIRYRAYVNFNGEIWASSSIIKTYLGPNLKGKIYILFS